MPTYRIQPSNGQLLMSFDAADPEAALAYVRCEQLPAYARIEWLHEKRGDQWVRATPDAPPRFRIRGAQSRA